jgi:hypothetical protein
MADKAPLAEREASIREQLEAEVVPPAGSIAMRDRGKAASTDAEIARRRKIARATRGNMHAARDPIRALVKRGKLLFADDDRPAVEAGERLREDLRRDRPDPSAAENALIDAAGLSLMIAGVAWTHIARSGFVRVTKDGTEAVNPAVAAAMKALGEMRQALSTLGLSRRAKSVRLEDLFQPPAPTPPVIDVTPETKSE